MSPEQGTGNQVAASGVNRSCGSRLADLKPEREFTNAALVRESMSCSCSVLIRILVTYFVKFAAPPMDRVCAYPSFDWLILQRRPSQAEYNLQSGRQPLQGRRGWLVLLLSLFVVDCGSEGFIVSSVELSILVRELLAVRSA